jgi:hypothetical protein
MMIVIVPIVIAVRQYVLMPTSPTMIVVGETTFQ